MENKWKFHLSGIVYTIFIWVAVQAVFDGIASVSLQTVLSGTVFGLIFSVITQQRYQQLLDGGIEKPSFFGIFRRKKQVVADQLDLVIVARQLRDRLEDATVLKQGNTITVTRGKEGKIDWALVKVAKQDNALWVTRPFSIWRDPTKCEVLMAQVVKALQSPIG